MHAGHVESFVRMRDHVTEPGGSLEPRCKIRLDATCLGESAKRVSVGRRRAELERHACGNRDIDHDLYRLPQMKDDGVRHVARRDEIVRALWESCGDAGEMTLDDRRFFPEDFSIERAQRESSASTSS